MDNRSVKIGKKDYLLSARKAADVLELAAACSTMEQSESLSLINMAQVINDSIKSSGKSRNIVERIKYRKFTRKGGSKLILLSLSSNELVQTYLKVLELEGVKKKTIQEMLNRLDVTSQDA